MNRWKYPKARKRAYLLIEALVAIAILTGVLALFSKSFMRHRSIEKSLSQVEFLAREAACIAAAKKWLKQTLPQPLNLLSNEGIETELEIKGPLISQGKLGHVTQKVKVRISKVSSYETSKEFEHALLCMQIDKTPKKKSPTFEVVFKKIPKKERLKEATSN